MRMGKLSACLAIALAACGSSNSKPADAPPIVVPDAAPDAKVFQDAPIDAPPVFDLACVGNSTYPAAAANVTISGTAYQVDVSGITPSMTPLAGAKVEACQGNCAGPNSLATATSDSSGGYSDGPIATGGTHLAVYLKITPPMGSTDEPVLEYPGEDLTADFMGAPVFTLTPGALTALMTFAGCTVSAGNTILGVAVTDCSNTPITDSANVMLSIKNNGSDVTGTTTINLGQFTAMAKGTYLVCNVPASTALSVGATYKGMTFLAHDVTSVANEITATQVRPGV
jgi:hypothetical protein